MGSSWKENNRVFIFKFGDYMQPNTCDKIISKSINKYNLSHIIFHELKHISASILIHKGINPKVVSQRLGHSSTDITMEIYSHTFDITKKESAIAFDEIIENV